MSFGTYRQYDSRWGSKNYNGSSSYATAGCGPTSCANILYAINPNITPLTTGSWMKKKGYAIRNNGTAWAGIPACLKAFGAKDVRNVSEMADVYSYCSKGYVGVFLFRAGTRGGVTWTTSGHYIAVTGYKHSNGKHYFKTFDSGGRKHDGWYCYETTMRGLIPEIWLCKVSVDKVTKPKGKYSGAIPAPTIKKGNKGNKGDKVKQLQRFLNWYHPFKLTVDGEFGNKTEAALKVFQKTEGLEVDGIYGAKSQAKAKTYYKAPVATTPKADKLVASIKKLAWAYGTATKKYAYKTGSPKGACKEAMIKRGYKKKADWSDCGYFVNTVLFMALGIKVKVLAKPKEAFPSLSQFTIVHKGSKIPSGLLKAGDIIRYKKTSGSQHVMFYLGDGKIAEGGREIRFPIIKTEKVKVGDKYVKKYDRTNIKFSTLEVWRIKE